MTEPTQPASAQQAPTCYRHPDRETYVRCTRCDRPICPDCMVSASVGFQCPECVAEGNKDVRQARTQFGGSLTGTDGVLTRVLIGLNLAVFVIQLVQGIDATSRDYGMFPVKIADGEYYRLLTSGFLHASFVHILLNMAALYFLGLPLEGILGRWRFALLYGMSLLGGSVASFCFSPYLTIAVGASGAIFGLMGGFGVVAWKKRLDMRPFIALITINLVFGFVVPGIDWRAHLGGLVVGAIMAAAYVVPSRQLRIPVLVSTVLVVLVLLGAATAWRVAELRDMFPGQLG